MFSKPGPERALAISTVDEPGCGTDNRMMAAPDSLETLLRRLLPTPVAPTLPQTSTHGIREDATMIAAGGADTPAHSTSQV